MTLKNTTRPPKKKTTNHSTPLSTIRTVPNKLPIASLDVGRILGVLTIYETDILVCFKFKACFYSSLLFSRVARNKLQSFIIRDLFDRERTSLSSFYWENWKLALIIWSMTPKIYKLVHDVGRGRTVRLFLVKSVFVGLSFNRTFVHYH